MSLERIQMIYFEKHFKIKYLLIYNFQINSKYSNKIKFEIYFVWAFKNTQNSHITQNTQTNWYALILGLNKH